MMIPVLLAAILAQEAPKPPLFDLLIEPAAPQVEYLVHHPKRDGEMLLRLNVVNRRSKQPIETPEPADYPTGLSLRKPDGAWVREVKEPPAAAGRRLLAPREFFGKVVDAAPLLEPGGKPLDDGIYLFQWRVGDGLSNILPVVVIPDYRATFETNRGTFTIAFYPHLAPVTVLNFVALAKAGYYTEEGNTFHRVLPGKLIHGGCKTGDGRSVGDTIKGEFHPQARHLAGTISMARSGDDPDSGSVQFFLCAKAGPEYDGRYAAFGRVTDTEGLGVLQRIAETQTTHHKCPPCDHEPCKEGEKGCGTHHTDKPLSPVKIRKLTLEEAP